MTGGRGGKAGQQTKLDKYTIPKGPAEAEGPIDLVMASQTQTVTEWESPSLLEVMETIKGVRTSQESQIDSVTTEVGLLRADLRNMGSRMQEIEDSTSALREDNASLKTQVIELQVCTTIMQTRLEGYGGRSRRNNIRIVGVPERAGERQGNRREEPDHNDRASKEKT
ncbi:hypothetical protein NDU88_000425 [Pleurodeles waltl]|uniref:Uncharacterized protein n=1 Tax=Pleurodeles waltl TaxID=8319 RepID=A0AAV7S4J7_PLEWA|nr:hypothetical protein NDU88_000425 [Pleurodeles waltl]